MSLSLFELHVLLSENEEEAKYEAPANTQNYYHSVGKSVILISAWLNAIFHGNAEQIVMFIIFLMNFLAKTSGKKNTLYLHGPPSCGKTYFGRAVAASQILYGTMTNLQVKREIR